MSKQNRTESAPYIPYGERWEKECMRLKKKELVHHLRTTALERDDIREALREIRAFAKAALLQKTKAGMAADIGEIFDTAREALI
ncbi:MAG: hypothetical protein IJS32_08640 [Kiritimatiellae bacterium]|nr:hypothetical protein [Kiritimatiellia bacterium]